MAKEKSLDRALEDFKVYARGVNRLQALEKELNSLDTKKFKAKERAIRKKLKNVALIPEIEHDLRELKAQVAGIDLDYQKAKLDRRQSKEIYKLERKSGEFEDRLKHARKRGISNKQLKEINKIKTIEGKLTYLKKIISEQTEQVDETEKKTERALRAAYRKDISKKQLKTLKDIPHIKSRVSYIRQLLDSKEEELEKEIEKIKRKPVKKQLTKKEVSDIKTMPNMKGKINYLRHLLKQDMERLQIIESRTEKIPGMQRKITEEAEKLELLEGRAQKLPYVQGRIKTLFSMLANKSEQIAKEEGEIEKLKNKFGYLKHELEEKSDELEHKLMSRTRIPAKKKLLEEIYGLRGEINKTKLELNEKLTAGISESRWDIEREKQDLRKEMSELAAESKGLIEQEAQEINEQLIEELKEIKKKSENVKKEMHGEFLDKLLQVRQEFDERLEELEKKSIKSEKKKARGKEKEEQIEEEDKEENHNEIVQPFVPPPSFSKIKINKIKFKEEPQIKIRDDFNEMKLGFEDSSLPSLPPLPEIDFSSVSFKDETKSKKVVEELKPNFRLRKDSPLEPSIEHGEEHTSIEHEKHLLPQIAKEEFMKDLKQAVLKQKETKRTEEITLRKKPLKKELFLELEEFKIAEQGLEEIESKIKMLEKVIKENGKQKQKDEKEIQDVIEGSEEISGMFSNINNKILKKIKDEEL